ncbi:NUDIX hydrolase domain-like protein [Spinellus fusiger]|nr:NUDIX hydrolase domain-like protein [Spinellus fusiger]
MTFDTVALPPGQQIEYTKKARHGHNQDRTDENNVRQVAGCLPIDPKSKRVLLISSRKKANAWVLPKGGWETNETKEQAALRETWEEAGVKGVIYRHVGVFVDKSNKGKVKAHHWVYELEIYEVMKKFPERKKRERRWFTYEESLLAVKSPFIKEALRMSSLNPMNSPLLSVNHSSPLSTTAESSQTKSIHSFASRLRSLFQC